MKIKSKIFKNEFSDMEVEVYESGYIALIDRDNMVMTLGKPPNARTDLILKAIKYVEGEKWKNEIIKEKEVKNELDR
jgi:hypothetical protein